MGEAKPFRLLVVGIAWPPETFIARLLHGLAKAGVEVTIASGCRPKAHEFSRSRLRWLSAPAWDGAPMVRLARLGWMTGWAAVRSPRGLAQLARCLRHGASRAERLQDWYRLVPFVGRRWDGIYFAWNSAAITYLPLYDMGCPVVVSCRGAQVNVAPHDPRRVAIREGLRRSFERAAAVHCVSDDIRQEAERFGLDPAKVWIIRPAVDPSFFHPTEQPRRRDGTFRVITTGSLIARKGYEYALLSLRRLLDEGTAVQCDIIGEGPERQRVLFTIDDLGLKEHVRLCGRRRPEEVREALLRADAFILSSLSEGISNAVLEAMACGLPVVTTDCGGMREAVTDRVEGFVVPLRDPAAMAAALAKLAADPALRDRMGRAARERVLSEFSLNRQIDQWLVLYRTLLDGRKRAAG
jgi:colanic acid/amylovoran biosynthesis glycosyltransferase